MIQQLRKKGGSSAVLGCGVGEMRARWLDSLEELEGMQDAWNTLAAQASHHNLSFEPSFLIPALRSLSRGVRVMVVESCSNEKLLCGLAPFRTRGLRPVKFAKLWKHDQICDSTPLVRAGWEKPVWRAVFHFLREQSVSLLGMDTVTNRGALAKGLADVVRERDGQIFQRQSFERALFRPEDELETYRSRLSANFRKQHRRLLRRLEEEGDVEFATTRNPEELASWKEQFLQLEEDSWKGRKGTALGSRADTRKFFDELVDRAGEAGVIQFSRLSLNGEPVAMLVDLDSNGYGVAYKTCCSDKWPKLPLGRILETMNLATLHQGSLVEVDSGTAPNNELMNRVWLDRTPFQSLLIALGPGWPSLVTSWAPRAQRQVRWLKETLSRWKPTRRKKRSPQVPA